MEEKSEQDNKLELTTTEQAHTAVRGAAGDALNNKIASVSVFLQLDGLSELSNEVLKFSVKQPPKPDGESIENQVTLSAQQVVDEISEKNEGKDIEELISDLTEQIRKSRLNARDMEKALKSMKIIETVWGNLQTLAGNNPGKSRPPLIQTSVGIYFDLYYSPPEENPQEKYGN